jgi:type VI secretion system secreted protein Hcp
MNKMIRPCLAASLAAASLAAAVPAAAAVDMFLAIEGVPGESTDSKHKGEIDVLAWSWGMSQQTALTMSGAASRGRGCLQDLSLTKYQDKATTKLMGAVMNGTNYPKVKLTVRKAGEFPVETMVIEMEKVYVTSLSTGGSGGEDRLTENVTLRFLGVTATYTPQDETGKSGTPIPVKLTAGGC